MFKCVISQTSSSDIRAMEKYDQHGDGSSGTARRVSYIIISPLLHLKLEVNRLVIAVL